MSGRLSGVVGRTPISDRIKLFDGGAGGVSRKVPPPRPKTTPPTTTVSRPALKDTNKSNTTKTAPATPKETNAIATNSKAIRTDSNSSTKSESAKSSSSKSQKTTGSSDPTPGPKSVVSRQVASTGGMTGARKAFSSPKVVKKTASPSNSSPSPAPQTTKSKTTKPSTRTRVSLTNSGKTSGNDDAKTTLEEEKNGVSTSSSLSHIENSVSVSSSGSDLSTNSSRQQNASNSTIDEVVSSSSSKSNIQEVVSSALDKSNVQEVVTSASSKSNIGDVVSLSSSKSNIVSFDLSQNNTDDVTSLSSSNSNIDDSVSLYSRKGSIDECMSSASSKSNIVSFASSTSNIDEVLSLSSSKSSINEDVSLSSSKSDIDDQVSLTPEERVTDEVVSPSSRKSSIDEDETSTHSEDVPPPVTTDNKVSVSVESQAAPIVTMNIEDNMDDKVDESKDKEETFIDTPERTHSIDRKNANDILNEMEFSENNLNNKEGSVKKDLSFSEKKLKNKDDILQDLNFSKNNFKNKVDNESLVNNNFANLTDNQYFTNQALKNVNSATLSQAMKLDVEYKEDKITHLTRQLEELESNTVNEDEVKSLKKQKLDLDCRLREQDEELDDLASQVQLLEAGKTKLEMQFQQLKKEQRKELETKEDELEDVRAAAAKKVKILEQQLEQEHEERIGFLRERHELEGKIMNLQDMLERSGDEEQVAKLKRDLKKTKALLKDAQMMMDKTQTDGTSKVIMRQLKNQLEDAEFARTAAMKARQNSELELADVHSQLEDVSRSKSDLEDKNIRLSREKADLGTQLNENEEELQDVMKKYKASVAAVSTDQITIQDQAATIQELENERNKLREQYAEISQRLDHMEGENVSSAQHKRLELKIRELESKLELEKTTRNRLETQIGRGKEIADKFNRELDDLRVKESTSHEEQKKQARQLRDLREEYTTLQAKEADVSHKKADLEKQLEVSQSETHNVRNELKVAMKRIEDLQVAISGEIDSDNNSDQDSDSSDEEMATFLDHHRRAMSVQRERDSMQRDSVMRELSVQREMRGREMSAGPRDIRSMSRDIRASVAREFESATRDLHPVRETREIPEGIAEED